MSSVGELMHRPGLHRRIFLLTLLAALVSNTVPILACPDLQPSGFGIFGPQIVAPGERLRDRLVVFLHNTGADQAGITSIAFYISTDPIITTSDRLLIGGRDFRDALIAGSIDPVRRIGDLTVPADVPLGAAFLGVIVDEMQDVTECSELNNTALIPVMVRAPQNNTHTVPTGYATIAAAIAAAAEGDTIRILTGDYDEAFTVGRDLAFVGSGWDSTVIRTSTNNDYIMDVLDSANVTVRGIRFQGALNEPYFVARGIMGNQAAVAVNHCRFETIVNYSIQMDYSTISVDSCEFLASSMGVADVGVDAHNSNFWISHSYGGTKLDHVFDPWGTAIGVVENCTIDGSSVNWANGVRLRGTGPVAIVRNNLIVGQHNGSEPWVQTVGGIAAFGPMFVEIYGNTVHGFTHGLNIGSGATARVYDNTVTNNILVGVECFNNPVLDLGGGALGSHGLNVIQNNGTYSVRNTSTPDLYALHNYWGPGDSAAIDATMYDDEENASYGEVIFKPDGGYVMSGYHVSLATDYGFLLTFDSVSDPGVLTVVPQVVGPFPPRGLRPFPPDPPYFYDLMTGATHLGDIEVCYSYDPKLLTAPELALTLWHYEGSTWREITTSRDTRANQICGTVPSLSQFLLGTLSFLCGDANVSGAVSSADIIYMVNHVFKGGPPPLPVPASGDANSDDLLTSADIIGLVNYVFKSGSPPGCR